MLIKKLTEIVLNNHFDVVGKKITIMAVVGHADMV